MPLVASAVAIDHSGRRPAPAFVARSWRRDPRRFGRAIHVAEAPQPQVARNLASDLRLFLVTFLAGFVFVSILLA